MPQSSLADRMGGTPVLKKSLDDFYDKVMKEPTIGPFFKGVKPGSIKNHVLKFLRFFLADGRMTAEVTDVMLEKHMELFEDRGLSETHFDIFVGMLKDSFKEKGGVQDEHITELEEMLLPLRQIFVLGAQEYGGSIKSDADISAAKAAKRKGLRKLLAGLTPKKA